MTSSRKILLGVGAGVLVGLFFGERISVLQVAADGYVNLLQMTVLPYVVVSLVSGLGSLNHQQVAALARSGGGVMLVLWALALIMVALFPLMLPAVERASFFSTSLLEPPQPFDLVDLYIPSNPFHALANNVVPAAVLFSLVLGVALITVDGKERLLDVLRLLRSALSQAATYVIRLTPYGLFVIAATTAGTLTIEQVSRLQVYLISYGAASLLLALWLIPGLVSALTPVRRGTLLELTHEALITAFMTSSLFVVLPALTEHAKALAREHGLGADRTAHDPPGAHRDDATDIIVPASFNFPHAGKLLTLSFVVFAGWFADVPLRLSEYPQLAVTGLLVLFGNINSAVPFLLDLFRIPADTFQLFLATGVINSRFGTLVAAMHTMAVAIIGTWAMSGALQIERRRLIRYLVQSALAVVLTYGGVHAAAAWLTSGEDSGGQILSGMGLLQERGPAVVLEQAPRGEPLASRAPVLDRIRARGTLRVGYLSDSLPFAYLNASGNLVGFDAELAHNLARELSVALEFVPESRNLLADDLSNGVCDIVMTGFAVTTDRSADTRLSMSYLDETFAFVVLDHLRHRFTTWEQIIKAGRLRFGVPNVPYYTEKIRARLPDAELVPMDSIEAMFGPAGRAVDALLLTAERGSAWTLLHPEYSVVVPMPGPVRVPLAYPVAADDRFARFIDTWIDLKRKDGTIQTLYDYWILGRHAVPAVPRWSIVRDLLHWVD